jgi:predicted N-acetyltransferase YhbS
MPPEAFVRPATRDDLSAIVALHDITFGPGAYARTAYRIREGTPPISPFCLVSFLGAELVATVRFTAITIGGARGALLLGPLAVAQAHAGQGYGKALVARGVEAARVAGRSLVLLVGNESYYSRFGFVRVPRAQIKLPGPVDPDRLLAAETTPGALATARGLVAADTADLG